MNIGYIRVSTQEQNTIRQEVLMQELGVDEVYIDRMSGKNTNRPELKKMMAPIGNSTLPVGRSDALITVDKNVAERLGIQHVC